MPELFKTISSWLTTSGIKVIGILITLMTLSQMSKWIVKWLKRLIPENDPLQAAEARKRAQTLDKILHRALLIGSSFGENRKKNTILNDHWLLIIVN